ncbi:AAA family ATPase [Actinoplanes bogorensis]|uniref:AAA family ATPase n=1 Tax=Paractinoplanes bogorensis TaxID=1610840 RepID=A0ABS5YNH6_9ACTN|nr:helix-turn-helix transcriptional regulator [Actinoplanes bogorensis]MBU2664596.1 AAA family ATPase [Actinoplanes bogorensis]
MLYGRDAACAAIAGLVTAAAEGRGGSLVVRGEPGAGKTALLEHAAATAGSGWTVLPAAGVQSEAELAFATLHQLLLPLLDRSASLEPAQAAALRGAFELGTAVVGDRFLVSVAVLNLLSDASADRPVLCLVDDAQWIDQPSADVLGFVARRLGAERIALVVGRRDTATGFAEGLPELELPPLDAEASAALLPRLPPAVVSGLVRLAGGNPLALRELPSSLTPDQVAGRQPLDDRVPLPARLDRLFGDRLRALPGPVRALLLIAAAEETGNVTLVLAAAAAGADALDVAERSGLVRVAADGIVFRHPLIRAAAYQIAEPADRRAAHRALAAADPDNDRVAWHRAAAAVGTDEEVATALEDSAQRAVRRGGHAAAATALLRAAELSDRPAARARRLVAAADAARRSGRHPQAIDLLARAARADEGGDPVIQGAADHVRATIEADAGNVLAAAGQLAAVSERAAAADPTRALHLLVESAEAAAYAGDSLRSAGLGRLAAALPVTDKPAAFLSDLLQGMGRVAEGDSAAGVLRLRRAIGAAATLTEPRHHIWAGVAASFVGDEPGARLWFTRAVDRARATGALGELPHALEYLAELDLRSGRYADAAGHATEGRRLAAELGQDTSISRHLGTLACLAALRGADEECRDLAHEALTRAGRRGLGIVATVARHALALADLVRGRPADALTHLRAMLDARPGAGSPFLAVACVPDLVEAAARADRWEGVGEPLAAFERLTGPSGAPAARSLLCRARALLPGADADRLFAEAVRLGQDCDRPFELARTRLLHGEFLRRGKRRAEARVQLREAADVFDRLGAVPWAERAGAELRATGETARKRQPDTLTRLTPQERQIVRLVADGATNQQVAAQLFLSRRTVEYHLHNVFTKLGVSSRTALARSEIP